MKRRRSDLEICADILDALAKERSLVKTQIMYKASISFQQLERFLHSLLELELVQQIATNDKIEYKITEKGKMFIEAYQMIKKLMTKEK